MKKTIEKVYILDSKIEGTAKKLFFLIKKSSFIIHRPLITLLSRILNPIPKKYRPLALTISIPILLVVGSLGVYQLFNPLFAKASWMDENWLYRKAISVTNAGILQTDFQVSFTLDTATLITGGKMKSDCSDLRVTDAGGKQIPYWIEENNPGCNSASTKVWTKVPSAFLSGATVYVYYGNASASDAQNPSLVFEFFDDFKKSANVDTTKWNTSGSPSISSGILSLVNNAKLVSKNPLSNTDSTRVLGMRAKVSSTSLSLAKLGFSDTNTLSSSFDSNDTAAVMVGNEQAYHTFIGGSNLTSYHQLEETTTTDANQFKASGYLDTGKLSQAVSMYGNAAGTQGSTLTFNRGAQISGNNYEHINSNQGTISFWVKPSWNGNDGLEHDFLCSGVNCNVWFYKTTSNILIFGVWDNTGVVYRLATVATTSWISGSWYHIVARWDSDNTVASSNYVELYVNGSNSGVSNGQTANSNTIAPGANNAIGARTDGTKSAQALIDDFAIYDRVLTTTEITSLYNSGTGAEAGSVGDSSLKFYAKMDGSGTLSPVTYNLAASASKMQAAASELTGGTNLFPDGNMEAVGTTGWVISNGTATKDSTIGNVLFDSQSIKITETGSGGVAYKVVSGLTAGQNLYISAWAKSSAGGPAAFKVATLNLGESDGGGNVYIDKNIGTSWTHIEFPIKVNAGQTQIVVGGYTYTSGSSIWLDNISVTPNLVDNGGMEVWSGGLPTGWSNDNSTITQTGSGQADTTVNTGSYATKVVAGGSTDGIFQNTTNSANNWYLVSSWVKVSSGTVQLRVMDNQGQGSQLASVTTTSSSWTRLSAIVKPTTGNIQVLSQSTSAGTATWYVDDVSVIPLDNTALSFESWTPVNDSSSNNNQLSVQGSLTGVSSGTGKYGNAYTFDGSTGYLRQKTYATNIGDLSYSGNTFTDSGQTFTSYKSTTSPSSAPYMIVITNSDNTTSWGYIGNNGEGATTATIYNSKATSTAGWLGTSPTGKTPVGYEIRKTDYQITGGNFTLGAWIKTSATGGVVISKYNGTIQGGARISLTSGKASYSDGNTSDLLLSNTSVNDNNWHYVVYVESGTTSHKMYVDGALDNSNSSTSTGYIDNPNNFQIGAQLSSWVPAIFFNGTIDSPFVLSKALTADQVKALYNVSLTKYGLANSHTSLSGFGDGTSYSVDTNYHTFEITQKSSSVDFSIDGGGAITSATNPPSSNEYVRLENSDPTNTVSLDYLYVRKTYSSGVLSTSVSSTEEQGPGPVGYWSFDDGQGTVAQDKSSSNNDGTITGATWQTEDQCIFGKCLKFDGTSNYLQTGTSKSLAISGTKSISMGAWIRTTTKASGAGKYKTIVTIAEGGQGTNNFDKALTIDSSGYAGFYIYDTSEKHSNGTTDVTDDKWHYLFGLYDGTNAKIYVDGVQQGGNVAAATTYAENTPVVVISLSYNNYERYQGFLDEVKIYPYARTAAQIKSDYLTGQAKTGQSAQIGSSSNQWLSNGLVGYWKMDDNVSGNGKSLVDASGNSNTLTTYYGANTTGMDCTVAGKYGGGCSLDGVDDYVTKSSTNISTLPITLSVWAKATNINQSEGHILQTFNTGLYVDVYQGTFRFVRNGVGSITYSGSSGTWYHLVGIMDSNYNMSFYVNGSLVGTRAGSDPGSSSTVYLGAYSSGADFFGGSIDEARIYNRALSPQEVSDLYNWAPGPVGYWKMDDGTGTTVTDSSGNGFNGSWGSGGTIHWTTGKYGKAGLFSGANNDQVNIGDISSKLNLAVSTPPSFTLSAWLNPVTGGSDLGGITPIGNYARMIYRVTGDSGNGKVGCQLVASSTNVQTINAIPLGSWSYITCVYDKDAGLIKTYLNGILQGSAAPAIIDLSAAAKSFLIGKTQANFKGSIDDVKIYNYARTQAQILADMGTGQAQKQPLGYWKFDEGYGTTANNSGSQGQALQGTLTNMASPATSTSGWTNSGKFGKTLNFDGTNDYVSIPNSASLSPGSGNYTVSAWIKTSTNYSGSIGWIFSNYGSNTNNVVQLAINTDNKPICTYRDGSANAASINTQGNALNDNQWHHVLCTRTGTTAAEYVDGKQIGANTNSNLGTIDTTGSTKSIGAIASDHSQLFTGSIDEVKVYNYALTADEVKTEYNQGSSMQFGALGNNSSYAPSAANQEYCVPGDTTSCAPPIGKWDFEEKQGGTVNDTSGNNNTGTWNGAGSHWTSGKVGAAGQFNGSSSGQTVDYVSMENPTSLQITGDMTIEAWINVANIDPTKARGIVSKFYNTDTNRGYNFGINSSSGTLAFRMSSDGTNSVSKSSTVAITPNIWTHVSVTYSASGGSASFYVNGKLSNTATGFYNSIYNVGKNFEIGTWDTSTAAHAFIGSVDQVRIYNYARTPAQIAYDYNRGAPVGWWKFDECQGTTAHDSSGNGNNGTITIGATGTQTSAGTCTDGLSTSAWNNGKTGKRNYSLNFDGTDDYVVTSSNFDLSKTSTITISFWLNWAIFANDNKLAMEFSNNYNIVSTGFAINPNYDQGKFQVGVSEVGYNTSEFIRPSAGAWHHYVFVIDKTAAAANVVIPYVDGKAVAYTKGHSATTSGTFGNLPLYFMSRAGASLFGQGQIDDVRIYNYALTASQVKDIYNSSAVNFGP